MAARKKPLHPNRIEEMRGKIRATLLIKRLEEHVFTKPTDQDVANKVMADSQVRAALGLLGKILPNVSETKAEITGPGGADLLAPLVAAADSLRGKMRNSDKSA